MCVSNSNGDFHWILETRAISRAKTVKLFYVVKITGLDEIIGVHSTVLSKITK